MSVGKKLSILSGILTIIATYLFSWYAIDTGTTYYASGIGIIFNFPAMFTEAPGLGSTLGIPSFVIYIVAIYFILFLAAGLFQILGTKKRGFVLFGTLLVLGMGILIFLGSYNVVDKTVWIENMLGTNTPLVEGYIPWAILGLNTFDIGLYILYAAGIIGIIATIYGPGPF
jgi:glucan phosphoethanolaminetransferase (alkaline phosphatase superfamily)